MSDQAIQAQRFMVRIREPKDGAGGLVFTFVPKGIRQARRPEEQRQRVPRHIVRVRENGGAVSLDWKGTADDPGAAKSDMESEVHQRITERAAWLNLISELVGRVEQWVKELGWSTRRLDKQLDDPRIGKHTVPALLLQEDTVRVLLEPVSRDSIGGEGLVEFSLMPVIWDKRQFINRPRPFTSYSQS